MPLASPPVQQTLLTRTRTLMGALRPHQWVKNVLVFLPVLMAHRLFDPVLFVRVGLAFVAFSLLASGTYVLNDLVDRAHDRLHPTKQHRPFASGALAPSVGYVLAPLFVGTAFVLALLLLPHAFAGVLATYLGVTLAYSFALKRWVALDVVILGGLYALRVLAGAAATEIPVSEWLLAFSLFFFLSLALLKRYAELRVMEDLPRTAYSGRGYAVEDVAMLRGIGPATGFMAVLVLALYITSPEVADLYTHPVRLWLITPLLIYWTMHMWLTAHRRAMPDDPVLFTVKDPVSWAVGAFTAAVLVAATL